MPLTSRLVRQGKDVTIVATSVMVLEARRAAEVLEKAGIDAEIIDMHCVSHPDQKMILESVAKKPAVCSLQDTSWTSYGVVAEVCRIIATHAPQTLKAPVASSWHASRAPAPPPRRLKICITRPSAMS